MANEQNLNQEEDLRAYRPNDPQEDDLDEYRPNDPQEDDLDEYRPNDPQDERPEGDGSKKKEGSKSVGAEIWSWVKTILVALAIAFVVRAFIFEPVRVEGSSMLDTLTSGEIMFVSKLSYNSLWFNLPFQNDEQAEAMPKWAPWGSPARFDVVICRYPGRGATNFVKRVIGLPGDTLSFHGGVLTVNGTEYREAYIYDGYRTGSLTDTKTIYVPRKGDVMSTDGMNWTINGEVREDVGYIYGSENWDGEWTADADYYFVCGDHRNNSNDSRYVGPIRRTYIVGKVKQVVWPLNHFRPIPNGLEGPDNNTAD